MRPALDAEPSAVSRFPPAHLAGACQTANSQEKGQNLHLDVLRRQGARGRAGGKQVGGGDEGGEDAGDGGEEAKDVLHAHKRGVHGGKGAGSRHARVDGG